MRSFNQWREEFSFDNTKAARAEKLWAPAYRSEFPCLKGDDHYYLLRGRLEQIYFEMGRREPVRLEFGDHIKGYNRVVDEYVRTKHPDLYDTWRYIHGLDD